MYSLVMRLTGASILGIVLFIAGLSFLIPIFRESSITVGELVLSAAFITVGVIIVTRQDKRVAKDNDPSKEKIKSKFDFWGVIGWAAWGTLFVVDYLGGGWKATLGLVLITLIYQLVKMRKRRKAQSLTTNQTN